jgi:hypothetical protein
VTLAVIDKR